MYKVLLSIAASICLLQSAELEKQKKDTFSQKEEKIDFVEVFKEIESIYQQEKLRILREEQEIRKKTKQLTEEKTRIISETELIKAKIQHQKLLKQLNSLSKEMLDSNLEVDKRETDIRLKMKLLQLEKDQKSLSSEMNKEKLANEEKLLKMSKLKQEMEKNKKELELKEQKAKIAEQENKVKIKELQQKLELKQQEMEIKKQEAKIKKEQEELKKINLENQNRQFEMELEQQGLNYKLKMLLVAMNMENIKRAFFPITFVMEKTHFDGVIMLGDKQLYVISDKKLSDVLNEKLEKREKELDNAKSFLDMSLSNSKGGANTPTGDESEPEKIVATNKDLYISNGFEYEDFYFTILDNGKVKVEQKDYYGEIRKDILGNININSK